jgi:hypothetical protein
MSQCPLTEPNQTMCVLTGHTDHNVTACRSCIGLGSGMLPSGRITLFLVTSVASEVTASEVMSVLPEMCKRGAHRMMNESISDAMGTEGLEGRLSSWGQQDMLSSRAETAAQLHAQLRPLCQLPGAVSSSCHLCLPLSHITVIVIHLMRLQACAGFAKEPPSIVVCRPNTFTFPMS